jgi:PAS domain S-box-containing protein
VLNSQITALLIFTIALFLVWDVKHQILVAIYYNAVFAASILFNENNIYLIPNIFQTVLFVAFLTVMSVIAAYANYKLKLESIKKSILLEDSEKKFREIFENSTDGIFQLSKEGKFITVNPALVKILGYDTKEELLGASFEETLHKSENERERFNKLLEMQGKVENHRLTLKRKDGSDVVVRINAKIIYDESGKPLYYEGNMLDISRQVQAENEREKAIEALKKERNKLDRIAQSEKKASHSKTKYIAGLTHELRTPMNSVIGFLDLIENGMYDSQEELKKFAGNAKDSADGLMEIINNILDISKIEAGKMELEDYEFDLRDEVKKSISVISNAAKQKGLKLYYSVEDNIPEQVIGDKTRYRQILVNLLSNSVKFTEDGKIVVKVTGETHNNRIKVNTSVLDTGRGIKEEEMDKLFQPYSQVGDDNQTKSSGTGLGLLISKEFSNLMGGDISIKSKYGEGTRIEFQVNFKLNKQDEAQVVDEEPEEQESAESTEEDEKETVKDDYQEDTTGRKRLLLVEDNPISQDLENKILHKMGFEVEVVENGEKAVEAVKTGEYNLVLMDVEMEGMDGIETTKRIRDLDSKYSNIPIIAVTARSSMKDREKCLAVGMDDYISKPINMQIMKLTIDKLLSEER